MKKKKRNHDGQNIIDAIFKTLKVQDGCRPNNDAVCPEHAIKFTASLMLEIIKDMEGQSGLNKFLRMAKKII